MALVGDGVLAVTEGVPELDGAVAGTGDDLAVVGGEGDGQDVVGVADEAAGGDTGGELPEAEGLVPRGGQSVGTVGGDDLEAVNPLRLPAANCAAACTAAAALPPIGVPAGYVRSRRRCASGRGGSSWGNRTRSRRGSGSR